MRETENNQNTIYYKLVNFPDKLFKELKDYDSSYKYKKNEIYIKKADYNNLSKTKGKETKIFLKCKYDYYGDNSIYLIEKEITAQRAGDCELKILLNKTMVPCSIDHTEKKEKEIKQKKPHTAVLNLWNETCRKLLNSCENEMSKIEVYKKEKNHVLNRNLFFGPEYGEIILSNLNKQAKEIEKTKMEIEKLRVYYESI